MSPCCSASKTSVESPESSSLTGGLRWPIVSSSRCDSVSRKGPEWCVMILPDGAVVSMPSHFHGHGLFQGPMGGCGLSPQTLSLNVAHEVHRIVQGHHVRQSHEGKVLPHRLGYCQVSRLHLGSPSAHELTAPAGPQVPQRSVGTGGMLPYCATGRLAPECRLMASSASSLGDPLYSSTVIFAWDQGSDSVDRILIVSSFACFVLLPLSLSEQSTGAFSALAMRPLQVF
jgi:hypothetical protein